MEYPSQRNSKCILVTDVHTFNEVGMSDSITIVTTRLCKAHEFRNVYSSYRWFSSCSTCEQHIANDMCPLELSNLPFCSSVPTITDQLGSDKLQLGSD